MTHKENTRSEQIEKIQVCENEQIFTFKKV